MNRTLRFTRQTVLALSLSLAGLAGCEATKSDLELRYDAADRITVPGDRDQALAAVATDAADQNDTGVVRQALARIGSVPLRNETAAESAVRLVKNGQRADANAIALTIRDTDRRNATLKRLADNDPGNTDPAAKGAKNYLGD